jgi:hypothetical protein
MPCPRTSTPLALLESGQQAGLGRPLLGLGETWTCEQVAAALASPGCQCSINCNSALGALPECAGAGRPRLPGFGTCPRSLLRRLAAGSGSSPRQLQSVVRSRRASRCFQRQCPRPSPFRISSPARVPRRRKLRTPRSLLPARPAPGTPGWEETSGGTRRRCRARRFNGAAGVGLALLAAASSVEPEWDRALLVSLRNLPAHRPQARPVTLD